jgi:hypothetical protein
MTVARNFCGVVIGNGGTVSGIAPFKMANSSQGFAPKKKITTAGCPNIKQSATKPEEPKTGKKKHSAKKSREDESKSCSMSSDRITA